MTEIEYYTATLVACSIITCIFAFLIVINSISVNTNKGADEGHVAIYIVSVVLGAISLICALVSANALSNIIEPSNGVHYLGEILEKFGEAMQRK